jgi:hypothetical protein
MNAPNSPPRRGERWKLALAPMLALVLAAVLYQNCQPAAPVPPPARTARPAPQSAVPGTEAVAASPTKGAWPANAAELALSYDPFTPPRETVAVIAPQASPTAGAVASDEQASSGEGPPLARPGRPARATNVSAIYRVGKDSIAIVDAHIVRVGDVLDGRRILAITASDVLIDENSSD